MIASKAKHPNCAYKWMDWIVSPEVERAGRRVVRRGAGQRKACELTSDKTLLRHVPRRSTRPTRTRSQYWTTPIEGVPGRPRRRDVHGLRGVDAGLDGDQGLTRGPRRAPAGPRAGTGSRGCPPCCTGTPRLRLAGLLAAPLLWLLVVYLGSLAALFIGGVLDASTRSPARSIRVSTLDNLHDARRPQRRLPHRRAAHPRHRRRGDACIDVAARRADGVLHGQGAPRRGPACCLVVAVLMPLWASYLVKAYAWRAHARADGGVARRAAAARARRPRATASPRSSSRSPTSGCRT